MTPESSSTPLFVVVGNVNQGKSSVVAALSENEAIPIDSYPGTTKHAGTYVFKSADRELFRIVDTPGFQRPRQLLAWLQARTKSAADRPRAVREFVETMAEGGEFHDEVELLRPLLEGAGILYVVDASSHLEPSNEAEMEILRWTGQPAMALINRVRDRDHADEWRPTLRQFFHIVREFDAHRACFDDRVALLRGFREIRAEWSAAIDTAVAAMESEWRARRKRSAAVIADLMCKALAHVEHRAVAEGVDESAVSVELEDAYKAAQRKLEIAARDEVERVFRHPGLERDDPSVELLREDLFSETVWKAFGLTRTQLLKYGAGWGAAIGAGIDLAVGGLSFFTGTLIGAGIGAAAGWWGGQHVARVWPSSSKLARTLLPFETGRFVAIGPVTSPRYAWVLLDRALVHCLAVRDRSHARRDALELAKTGVVAELSKERRDALDRAMRDVLAGIAKGQASELDVARLETAIVNVLTDR